MKAGLLLAATLLFASLDAGAQTIEISEWLVPWKRSEPRDPYVDDRGRVWFAGERGDYIANLTPETGEFSRYDLEPNTAPQGIVVDGNRIESVCCSKRNHRNTLTPVCIVFWLWLTV